MTDREQQRKDLIERLEGWGPTSQFTSHEAIDGLLGDLLAYLKSDGWISVEDELPEWEGRIVIGYFPSPPWGMKTQKSVTMRDDDWQYVTHWQPLPEPPND